MTHITSPFFVIYVVWHPNFVDGEYFAERIREHYRSDLFKNVIGGAGVSVIYRNASDDVSGAPIPIPRSASYTSATLVLVEENLSSNSAWVSFVQSLTDMPCDEQFAHVVLPIAFTIDAMKDAGIDSQAMRIYEWPDQEHLKTRLIGELSYTFCRMLRVYLARAKSENSDSYEQFIKKTNIFLSHSKHDDQGESISLRIRDFLNSHGDLSTFFDVLSIPPGAKFYQVINKTIERSAVVVIYTDSYSSREWCRREVLEAKRHNAPIVVASCLSDFDERSFPYMGNVPTVHLNADEALRIQFIVSRLMDEVLKMLIWDCRVLEFRQAGILSNEIFLPRQPELISIVSILADARENSRSVIYPDPPLGAEEMEIIGMLAPDIAIRSVSSWLSGKIE